MLKTYINLVAIMGFATASLLGQEVISPLPVFGNLVSTHPYAYNGLIIANSAYGSGSMVGEGVMATAAHVVYNEDTRQWLAPSLIKYYPQSASNTSYLGKPEYSPVAVYRWDDYSSRVQSDSSSEGFSSTNTFNLDLAVGYFSSAFDDDLITEHAEVHIDANEDVTIHRHPREKMIVGYPQDTDFIPQVDIGRMHRTARGDYYAEEALDNDENPGFDFGNVRASVYYYFYVTTYGGGSGGPVYVRDDMNNWMMSGAVVGGAGESISLIRSIDENAWSGIGQEGMIEQAILARNGNAMRRVEDLQASIASNGSVNLQWSDHSTVESGYTVFRQENGIAEDIATLPENSTSYVDPFAAPGKVYHYQVQPFRIVPSTLHVNKSPKSAALAVDVPGYNAEASEFLNANFLKLSSSGKSSWYVDESTRLRAGVVRPLSSSSLFLDVIGPGTVRFDWSASSEVNEHYANDNPLDPDSKYFGLIYDAIWLYLNGNQVEVDDEPVFLSGPLPDDPTRIISESNLTLTLPEGAHRIEWRYEKDPYADDHQDTAFLDALSWQPDPVNAYPVYGAYQVADTDWHASKWFGWYETSLWPWAAHEALGWIYLLGGADGTGLYFNVNHPDLGTVYTTPDHWPYLYNTSDNAWMLYFEGTGAFGTGALFYHFGKKAAVRLP